MLTAIDNPSLADKVFEQLAREILIGSLAAEQVVPTERELTQAFGVNRHVVREAIQRLEQIGLVRTSQGGRTRVLDFTRHAGMDVLGMLARYAGSGPESAHLWLSVLQMRAAVAVDAARLCAQRHDPAVGPELLDLVERLRDGPDDREMLALAVRFWDIVIDASQNVAYRLAYNSLLRSLTVQGEAAIVFTRAELSANDFYQAIVDAIAAGDMERAERETQAALRPALEVYAAIAAAQEAKAAAAVAKLG